MELLPIRADDFDGVYDAMAETFPLAERRDREAARALLFEPRYRMLHTVQEGMRVGFVTVWELDGLTFVEHFVTYPMYRNKGCGARVIALLQARYPRLVLEAERPDTPLAARRLAFYRRCGFACNEYPYVQPPYHGEAVGVPLVLMSYPTVLENPASVKEKLYREVYRVPLV